MVKLEDFQMIVREREQLKKEKQELEYLWDINEELKEENKKLKEKIAEYENLPF
jgi:cell division protein FtsB